MSGSNTAPLGDEAGPWFTDAQMCALRKHIRSCEGDPDRKAGKHYLIDHLFTDEASGLLNRIEAAETALHAARAECAEHEARIRELEAALRKSERSAFYGGYSSALSVALPGEDGTHTHYVEAIGCVNAREFLKWAKENNDTELPRIKQAMRCIRERDRAARATDRR